MIRFIDEGDGIICAQPGLHTCQTGNVGTRAKNSNVIAHTSTKEREPASWISLQVSFSLSHEPLTLPSPREGRGKPTVIVRGFKAPIMVLGMLTLRFATEADVFIEVEVFTPCPWRSHIEAA